MSKKSTTTALTATHGSDKTPLIIGEIEIPCYVLNDGTRVFSGRGIQKAIGGNPNASGTWLTKFVNSSPISDYLSPGLLAKFNSPIAFKRMNASGSQSSTYGYEATILIDICDAILQASKSRKIDPKIHGAAEIILRSVAKVGIIALVDEATGYQNDVNRAKDELQQFLHKFILQERAAAWIKTFPDEFFEMIFKMNGWTWNDFTKNRKPSAIGHFINNYVYSRLAPLVLEELRRKNPINPETGSRQKKHHQWLSPDLGHPKLKEHFVQLFTIWKLSNGNKQKFESMLNTALPKFGQTLSIIFPDEDDKPDTMPGTFNAALKGVLSVPPPKRESKK